MAICTTAEYKAERGITTTDWDTLTGTMIDTQTAKVERYCGRTAGGFEGGTFTERFNGDGSQCLRVSNGAISSITSIKTGQTGSQSTVSASTYEHDGQRTIYCVPLDGGGNVRRDDWGQTLPIGQSSPSFPRGFQNIEVVYVTASEATDDLKEAVYRLIDYQMASRGMNIAVASHAMGNETIAAKTASEFADWLAILLGPWRSIR